MSKLVLILSLAVTFSAQLRAQETVVYLVRHAEKETNPQDPRDPGLSPIGFERAMNLDDSLKAIKFDAVYSSDYKRTVATAQPVATRNDLVIIKYDPSAPSKLVEEVNSRWKGKTVLIVGHSNTLLPLIEAFGGKATMQHIDDNDYSNIFRLQIGEHVTLSEKKF